MLHCLGDRSRACRWLASPAIVLVFLLGCSNGVSSVDPLASTSSGSGSGSGSTSSPPPSSGGTGGSGGAVTASVAWAAATGPVAGYRVYVDRNGGGFAPEQSVTGTSADISGQVGDMLRIEVAATDASGNEGPLSPPSKVITLTDPTTTGAAATTAVAATPVRQTLVQGSAQTDPTAASDATQPPPAAVPDDLDGDGRADLVWTSADGTRLRITGADGVTTLDLQAPGAGFRVLGVADFDGDGRGDILWQNDLGELAVSRSATLFAASGVVPIEPWATLASGERVAALGDFDGDARADALIEEENGDASLWLGRDGTLQVVALPAPEAGAKLEGSAGDQDGDGSDDVVWRTATGGLVVDYLVAGQVDGSSQLPVDASVEVLAHGDFDADGLDELVLRESGSLVVQSALSPDDRFDAAVDDGSGPPTACADYDGDGSSDLVWQLGDQLRFWYLPGEEFVPVEPGWVLAPVCF